MKYQKQKLGKKTFTIATRKIKYIGIHLSKEVNELYSENYRTLKKVIWEDTNKCKNIKNILCSWIGRINIIKMSILSKAIYKFNVVPMH